MTTSTIHVASEFSRFPAGRFKDDGPYPGEAFRDNLLVPALRSSAKVVVDLDGTLGYGSSFLEEAFGGLVRVRGFSAKELRARLELKATDPARIIEIWGHIDSAKVERA